jgi:(p)ppGpp synthase/HD superfamily hydrolase
MDPPSFICDLPLTCEAFDFAQKRHAGRRRESDAAPFILHPLEVAVMLRNRGFGDEVVAAGLLHDTVEDSAATPEEIADRFGDYVGGLVAACTDDRSIADFTARKAALRESVARAGTDAQAIYAADKIAKARELRAELTRDPARLAVERVQQRLHHYEASVDMLEAVVPESPLVRQLRFELWALRHLPPQGAG